MIKSTTFNTVKLSLIPIIISDWRTKLPMLKKSSPIKYNQSKLMAIRATTHDVRQYSSLLQCLILESCTHPHSHTHTYTSINGLYHHRRYCKKGRKKEKSSSLCRVMLSHLWFAHPSHRYLLPCASFFLGAFARVPRPSLFSLSLSLSPFLVPSLARLVHE